MITYSTIIHEAEEGGYWAEVPSMPGCFSQGESLAEVKANIQEAAEGWLLSQLEFRFSRPVAPRTRTVHTPAKRATVRERVHA